MNDEMRDQIPDEKWFRENSYKIPGHEHDFTESDQEESNPDQPQLDNESKASKLPKGDKTAEILVNLTLESGVELYLDQLGEPHASLPEKPVTAFPLRSLTFRRWLAGKYWEEHQKGFSGDTFQTVAGTLEGKAFHEAQSLELHNRIARVNGVIYYDLGDDIRAVKIAQSGWEITGYPNIPVKFRRFNHQMTQVEPIRGGKLDDILEFINLKTDTDKLLLLTYLVAACIPDIPRVALINTGDQGSAKSTSLRVIRSLIDPSQVELLDPISDLKELAQAANHHYCLYLDNLSYLRDELSDALSRLVTGIGFTKRKLFSDDDDIIFAQKVAVGISGVNLVATRPDLLDRCLILSLERIPEELRKDETEFWNEFELVKPQILGGLFDVLSKVLSIYPDLKLSKKPRMADYAKYAAAAAVALGYTADDFLLAYGENTGRQNQAAIESSPTAQVVIQFMSDKDYWEGLASELHSLLLKLAEELKLDTGGRDGFPKASNWLWRKITPIRPNLIALGIEPQLKDTESGSLIQLSKGGQNGSNTSSVASQEQKSSSNADAISSDASSPMDASRNTSMPNDGQSNSKTASMEAMQATIDTLDVLKEGADELPF